MKLPTKKYVLGETSRRSMISENYNKTISCVRKTPMNYVTFEVREGLLDITILGSSSLDPPIMEIDGLDLEQRKERAMLRGFWYSLP